jgi:hypothetical protein
MFSWRYHEKAQLATFCTFLIGVMDGERDVENRRGRNLEGRNVDGFSERTF